MPVERFRFAFDPRFVAPLALLGVREANSEVAVDDAWFEARFGPWRVRTPTANLRSVELSRGYRWFKAIGPRMSLADRGLTFGSNARAGVCVCFHEPVPGLFATGWPRHPGLTVTVEDPDALVSAVSRRLTVA